MPTNHVKNIRTIPPEFKKFFWDADFAEIRFPDHENYILGRLMGLGDLASIVWILQSFTAGEIRMYLEKRGSQTLDRKSFLFWEKVTEMESVWR